MTLMGMARGGQSHQSEQVTTVQLRLIATTDLHAHLFPFNYYADRRDDAVGLARAAALIASLRAEMRDALDHFAARLDDRTDIWISKHKLASVLDCEELHLTPDDFEWSPANALGWALIGLLVVGSAIWMARQRKQVDSQP